MFDITTLFKTFLGANTANGFVSHFGDSYSPDDGWRAYIIKGGPGTGKSSLMKQIAAVFAEKGSEVELCPCSSDPDSLDAVIIHDKKAVIMDGTAPHTVDPAYPGACETVVNLSDCWDRKVFCGREAEIIAATRENKAQHNRASRYISVAGELLKSNYQLAAGCTEEGKVKAFAKKLALRTIKRGSGAKESVRFLSGITPKGLIFLRGGIEKYYTTVIAVKDDNGAVSAAFMKEIRRTALSLSQRIITCKNTVNPDVLDHVLLPDLSLAFCTENRYTHPLAVTRRIHARRFTDTVCLKNCRQKINFNRRAAEQLLHEAVRVIGEAKMVHDRLESYYIDAMDFEKVGGITARIISEIEELG